MTTNKVLTDAQLEKLSQISTLMRRLSIVKSKIDKMMKELDTIQSALAEVLNT